MKEILKRISDKSKLHLSEIINNYSFFKHLKGLEQDEKSATFYKRRKPFQSEILIDDFKKFTAKQIYDKIRALQDPYPNSYVICEDGNKVYLTGAKIND